jgi:polyphosphate kinase 2 (PPK2 family)
MGFATDEQVAAFLDQVPNFEKLLVDDGILLFKYWLTCDQEEQEERLRERAEDPLKRWKLSQIDIVARKKYGDYTEAREAMLEATHHKHAPWTLVDFNDQHLGRLTLIRDFLDRLPDKKVDAPDVEFEVLQGEPETEWFAVLKPIKPYKA